MEENNKKIIVENFINYISNVINNIDECSIDFSYIKSKGWNIIFKVDNKAIIRDSNPYLVMNRFNKYFYKNTKIQIINKIDSDSINNFIQNIDFCTDKINEGYKDLFFVIKYIDGNWYQRIFLDKHQTDDLAVMFKEDKNIINVI